MGQPNDEGLVPLVVRRVPLDEAGRPKHHMYNSDALWLTMWNLNVLWGLGWPEMLDEFSASMIQYASVGGRLPNGPSAGGYTGIMGGRPATSLITATWQKGLLTKVDETEAYETMRRDHSPVRVSNHAGRSVQDAFEYWALAQMAKEMGRDTDAKSFEPVINGWRKHFDPEKNLLSGRWVEANDWQGTFGVSHDIAGLAELMGGPDDACEDAESSVRGRSRPPILSTPTAQEKSATPTSRGVPTPMCSIMPASRGSANTGCAASAGRPTAERIRTAVTAAMTKTRARWAESAR